MPNGCCPSGSIIILLLSGKGQLAPKAGGLTFPAVVSSFPSSLAGTEISKVLLSSPCLSLSPGTCAFAEFHFTSFHFISFHCNSQRGSRRKGSKGDKNSPRRSKLTDGTLLLQMHPCFCKAWQLRCSAPDHCMDLILWVPALLWPLTATLYMWTALNVTLQKYSLYGVGEQICAGSKSFNRYKWMGT